MSSFLGFNMDLPVYINFIDIHISVNDQKDRPLPKKGKDKKERNVEKHVVKLFDNVLYLKFLFPHFFLVSQTFFFFHGRYIRFS